MPTGTEGATSEETQQQQQGETTESNWGENFDAERAKLLITKLRQEAKQASKQLKDYESLKLERQQHQDAQLSKEEQLSKQLSQTQAELKFAQEEQQERSLNWEIERQASRLGIVDPDAASKLLDRSELDFDSNGKVTNLETVLKDLAKSKPYLVSNSQTQQQQANQGIQFQSMNPTNPGRQTSTQQQKPTYNRSQFLDREFYKANSKDMVKAMTEGRIID